MQGNTDWLRDRFIERLLALSPASVLDLGAGHGQLVATCRAAGVEAWGVEPEAASLEAALPQAQPFLSRADATSLPFEDGQFEWVTLRHVPHHLEEPHGSFAEAWRVASRGLLVAEPWFDLTDPGQRVAASLDRFLKRLDRRRGMFHADVFDVDAIRELLPQGAEVAHETVRRPGAMGLENLDEDLARSSTGLTLDEADRSSISTYRAQVAAGEISWNGSVFVRLER
ncbi:MAG: class I SAM-dependent methyltransferase [Planctomycetota bacterium]|nr:class I SAM-dependent methyltransferase [Planctomycetota bacterium]